MALPDLDDLSQTVIYIPRDETDSADEEPRVNGTTTLPLAGYDIPDGPIARLDAYRAAWSACLERIKSVVHALHAPLAREIAQSIRTAYDDPLPALPYPEIPVFAVCDAGDEFIFDIASRLESGGKADDLDGDGAMNGDVEHEDVRPARVLHLRPSECTNIMAAMRTLISGFVSEPPSGVEARRKPTTSLATFDIKLLKAWYRALRAHADGDPAPQLVVIMHGFEQYDPVVVADMFHICSAHVPDIPLVFILALSSPPTPSFIHQTYRRATLSLLRLQIKSLPHGSPVLQKILLDTFFAFDFQPPVMPGSSTLAFLADFFMQHAHSLDGVYTILKLAHLRHFEDPLTLLSCPSSSLSERLASPDAVPFLTALLARLTNEDDTTRALDQLDDILEIVNDARDAFVKALRQFKVALRLFLRVRDTFVESGQLEEDDGVPRLLGPALDGDLSHEIRFLADELRKSAPSTIAKLRKDLLAFTDQIPKEDASVIREELGRLANGAVPLSDWIFKYCEKRIVNLSEWALADIWFMGSTPFPSELINPAPRSTILAGLSDPYAFVEGDDESVPRPQRALWEMPDISILFRRYLEAGRMVNIYDWYESFALVLDRQREQVRKLEGNRPDRKGKGKAAERTEEEDDEGERWKIHVQARFMRALQELDFLGFVKHTGRKADHVIRTVYDAAD